MDRGLGTGTGGCGPSPGLYPPTPTQPPPVSSLVALLPSPLPCPSQWQTACGGTWSLTWGRARRRCGPPSSGTTPRTTIKGTSTSGSRGSRQRGTPTSGSRGSRRGTVRGVHGATGGPQGVVGVLPQWIALCRVRGGGRGGGVRSLGGSRQWGSAALELAASITCILGTHSARNGTPRY